VQDGVDTGVTDEKPTGRRSNEVIGVGERIGGESVDDPLSGHWLWSPSRHEAVQLGEAGQCVLTHHVVVLVVPADHGRGSGGISPARTANQGEGQALLDDADVALWPHLEETSLADLGNEQPPVVGRRQTTGCRQPVNHHW
jgi:hypothetical protein